MRLLTLLLISTTMPLGACNPSQQDGQSTDLVDPTREPQPKAFRGVFELTPEARSLLSQQISGFGGRKSVADIKIEIVRNLLRDDLNGNGLSHADFADTFRQQDAGMRLQGIMQVFRSDYDGNAVVTKAEFDKTVEIERLRRKRQMDEMRARNPQYNVPDRHDDEAVLRALTEFRNADGNGDTKITLEEAYRAPNEMMKHRSGFREARQKPAFALDFNKDGLVTKEEIEAGIDVFIVEAKDAGVTFPAISEQPDAYRRPQQTEEPASSCALAKPSAKAKIIRLSAYEGNQLSNITLAGQDEETTTSEVRIEPGSDPLYVVASSYEGQIWRFTGAVGRIEHVLLSSWQKNEYGHPAAGLTGVARGKMSSTTPECIGGYYDRLDATALLNGLGRNADIVATFYNIAGVSLPSKAQYKLSPLRPVYLASERSDVQTAWKEFTRFVPAGIYSFSPAAVVTNGKAERYSVLPHQAGLVQLLLTGAIQKSDRGYVVRKPMRFPGSMGGAHSTTFIVPAGVPVPSGTRSHNCVRVHGKPDEGPTCGIR